MISILAVIAVPYLVVGALVLVLNWRHSGRADDDLDLEAILARQAGRGHQPFSLKLASILGTGLAFAVGLIIWPTTLRSWCTKPEPSKLTSTPRIVRQPDRSPGS